MSAVAHAAALVAFPVAAAIIGAVAVSFRRLNAKVGSGVQHFAGGVVIAALARRFVRYYGHHSGATALQGSLRWHQAVARTVEADGWDAHELDA